MFPHFHFYIHLLLQLYLSLLLTIILNINLIMVKHQLFHQKLVKIYYFQADYHKTNNVFYKEAIIMHLEVVLTYLLLNVVHFLLKMV